MERTRIPVDVETRAPGGQTNAYVVGRTDALLVDPARRTPALDEVLADRTLAHVAVTHHHPDHVGAVAAYAREFDATVWARAGREDAFESATGIAPDRTFRDGTVIPLGDSGHVGVVETPGHAPEHVAFAVDEDLLVGDLAVAEGSVVVGAPEGDVRAYLSSLRRVHARISSSARLLPGHGPVVTDPRAACARLIEHRLDREQRVLAAVESGATLVDDVLDAAYEKDLTGVRDLAGATVRAHLEKLAAEGRVEWDGRRVRPA
ncbi:Glyoxylase, beta-lactamase superfamily II [Halomicrobium zhouii]|uniref:Glyoxylase, beta-lactamase superfamily II n=1 Tax=Halomicrobium zhouii TaxID=767519 RepID=A0A1I6LFM2_9EURY|nr:MBL fold metallo-hydrolase [Halomicrobium zhouii]SFS02212.1 Glyoxylase, beta-lactamase superfamily II [Halomicrobium zhouii]